jgi:hypothetical protein
VDYFTGSREIIKEEHKMNRADLQKHQICPRDNENLQSLHYFLRQNVNSWKKADLKICPKCSLVMFFKKNNTYVIYPDIEKVKILK